LIGPDGEEPFSARCGGGLSDCVVYGLKDSLEAVVKKIKDQSISTRPVPEAQDDDIEKAIALSLQPSNAPRRAAQLRSNSDEDEELAKAIQLSLASSQQSAVAQARPSAPATPAQARPSAPAPAQARPTAPAPAAMTTAAAAGPAVAAKVRPKAAAAAAAAAVAKAALEAAEVAAKAAENESDDDESVIIKSEADVQEVKRLVGEHQVTLRQCLANPTSRILAKEARLAEETAEFFPSWDRVTMPATKDNTKLLDIFNAYRTLPYTNKSLNGLKVFLLEESLKEYAKLGDLDDMNTFLQEMAAALYAPTQPDDESFVSAFDLTNKSQTIWNMSEGGKFKKSRIQNRKQTMRSKKNRIMKSKKNQINNVMKKSRNIQTHSNIMKKSRNIQTHSNVMKKSRNVKKQY
jgi:hypothetical protein